MPQTIWFKQQKFTLSWFSPELTSSRSHKFSDIKLLILLVQDLTIMTSFNLNYFLMPNTATLKVRVPTYICSRGGTQTFSLWHLSPSKVLNADAGMRQTSLPYVHVWLHKWHESILCTNIETKWCIPFVYNESKCTS